MQSRQGKQAVSWSSQANRGHITLLCSTPPQCPRQTANGEELLCTPRLTLSLQKIMTRRPPRPRITKEKCLREGNAAKSSTSYTTRCTRSCPFLDDWLPSAPYSPYLSLQFMPELLQQLKRQLQNPQVHSSSTDTLLWCTQSHPDAAVCTPLGSHNPSGFTLIGRVTTHNSKTIHFQRSYKLIIPINYFHLSSGRSKSLGQIQNVFPTSRQ